MGDSVTVRVCKREIRLSSSTRRSSKVRGASNTGEWSRTDRQKHSSSEARADEGAQIPSVDVGETECRYHEHACHGATVRLGEAVTKQRVYDVQLVNKGACRP